MTNNHLLLYRLAELMLDKQQHLLSLDDLFEDEQIGSFVKSIQIDSPYQQLIFEGVITETIKKDQLMVSFTVEGYFHYVLGEVIEKRSEGKHSEYLKELVETNKLRGVNEGVKQCLVRDVELDDLTRLLWLIDQGGKVMDVCIYPLAQAFLIVKGKFKTEEDREEASKTQINKVLDELLNKQSKFDIEILSKTISKLEDLQLNKSVKTIYRFIQKKINPIDVDTTNLICNSVEHIEKSEKKILLNKLEKKNNEKFRSKELYNSLGIQFGFFGDYIKSIQLLDKAIKLTQKNDLSLINYYNSLGAAHGSNGKTQNSIKYYKKALNLINISNEKLEASKIRTLTNLGSALIEVGEINNGLDFLNEALDLAKAFFGKTHISTSKVYNSISLSQIQNKVDLEKSLKYLNLSINIREKIYGFNHPLTATSLSNIATIFQRQKKFDKAIEFNFHALKIREENLGKDHDKTAVSYNNLGSVFFENNQVNEAVKWINKAIKIWEKNNDKHPSLLSALNNLAVIHQNNEDFDLALAFNKKVLRIRKQTLNKYHPDLFYSYYNLGGSFFSKKEFQKSIKHYKKAIEISNKTHGENNDENLEVFYALGLANFHLKKFSEAIKNFMKAKEINSNVGGIHYYLALCFKENKNRSKSIESYKRCIEIRRKSLGDDHEITHRTIKELEEFEKFLKDKND